MQIERMLAGSPVHIDDLDDEGYVLVAATLPRAQTCADAATRRSSARIVWDAPLPLGTWRYATRWAELGLDEQPDPRPVSTR
jgi:hypothetical protein